MTKCADNTAWQQRLGLPNGRVAIAVLAAVLFVGIAARLGLCYAGLWWGYVGDLKDNVCMGRTAAEHGLLNVYSVPVEKNAAVTFRWWHDGKWLTQTRPAARVANYPPLGIVLFYASSGALKVVDPSMLVNTFTSKIVMAIPAVVAETILAVGVFLLARRMLSPRSALLAAAGVWLFPPLLMDSAMWGQNDAWPLAPAVFAMLAMLDRRWWLAGALFGLGTMLKPHGILFAPVALMGAWLAEPHAGARTATMFGTRVGKMVAAALLTVGLITLPWMIANGIDWLQYSYMANFSMYPITSLSAFNIWYLEGIGTASEMSPRNMDAKVEVLGLSKDLWGKLLLLGALALLTWLLLWRSRLGPTAKLTLFTGLWLWCTFMLPTSVHERYIAYCMPFMVVATLKLPRLWPALAVLVVIGAAEMTSHRWARPGPPNPVSEQRRRAHVEQVAAALPRKPTDAQVERAITNSRRAHVNDRAVVRQWEFLATTVSIAGYVYAMAMPFLFRGQDGTPRART